MPRVTNVSNDKVYVAKGDSVRHVLPGETVDISDADLKNASVNLLASNKIIEIEKRASKSGKKKTDGGKEKKSGKRKSTN